MSFFGSIGFCESVCKLRGLYKKFYDSSWMFGFVGDFVSFMGKVIISVGTAWASYLIY